MIAAMAKKTLQMHLFLSEDLEDALGDYRWRHRFKSQSSAARFLLQWALKQDPEPTAEDIAAS
jgi:hypothetical protein